MEITAHNFLAQLPFISASIKSADFIAFDTEFSGKLTRFHALITYFSRLLRKVGGSWPRLRHLGGAIPKAQIRVLKVHLLSSWSVHIQVGPQLQSVLSPSL